MHKFKYHGPYAELQGVLREAGVRGVWYPEPGGRHMLRHHSGANLHFASTNGTIWIDGKRNAAVRLEWQVGDALGQPIPRGDQANRGKLRA